MNNKKRSFATALDIYLSEQPIISTIGILGAIIGFLALLLVPSFLQFIFYCLLIFVVYAVFYSVYRIWAIRNNQK